MRTILQHPSWLLSYVCRDNLNLNTKTKYLAYFIKALGSKGGGNGAPPWLRSWLYFSRPAAKGKAIVG